MKSILIVVIATVLILVTAPTVATACMEMTANNFDFDTGQKEAAVPLCCLTADCPLSHHILTNVIDNEVILPSSSTPTENVYLVWSATSVTT